MVTFRAIQAANQRRQLGDDDKYYRHMPFVFELRVKDDSYVYPLVLNPQRYAVSTPFTLKETYTLFGGVVVEENGIVVRRISIEGTTGLLPKPVIGATFPQINNPSPSFTPRGSAQPTLMSGQRHLQFLEDRIFRTYGDLKKNPDTSADTTMRFHVLKDNDSFLVTPITLDISRAVPRSTFSMYRIELLAVKMVDAIKLRASPDKGVIGKLQDAHDTIRGAYNQIVGAIKDITRFIRDVERTINGIGADLVALTHISDVVADLVDGVSDSIAAPFNVVTNTANNLKRGAKQILDANIEGGAHVAAAYDRARDALNQLALHPRLFNTAVNVLADRGRATVTTASRVSNEVYGASREALEDASSDTTPVTSEQFGKMAVLPGDLDRSRAQSFDVGNSSATRGFKTYTIKNGDTLPTIAIRELTDITRWREIAYANKLEPPYITNVGLPNTVQAGDVILVPSDDPQVTVEDLANSGVVGIKTTDSVDDRLYGRDLAFVADENGIFDIPIDYDIGAKDGQSVRGIACISQGLILRVAIERGHYPLYPNVGFIPLVGLRSDLQNDMIEIRVSETLLEDSRVRAVTSVGVSASDLDVRSIEADVVLVGRDQAIAVESSVLTR